MAGKTARANDKRKTGYKNHPATQLQNVKRRQQTHLNALMKKLRKFQRYVEAGKMTEAQFSARKERIEKEIGYVTGDLKRPEVRTGRKSNKD